MVFIVSERLRVAQVSVSLNEKLAWDLGKKKKKVRYCPPPKVLCVYLERKGKVCTPPPNL